jgi:hypothetical protein
MAKHSLMLKPRLKERNMHEEDGQVCDVKPVRKDHVAGEDNLVAYRLVLKQRLRKKYARVRWTGSWRHNSPERPRGRQGQFGGTQARAEAKT